MSMPLIIAAIDTRPNWGALLISCCPGRTDLEHDLAMDIAALQRAGTRVVVTLTEHEELEELEVPGLGQAVREAGMAWFYLPIRDYDAPDEAWEQRWQETGEMIRERIRRGDNVHMHCRGGCGRSGMLAARLLVELGICSPAEAIKRARLARPCAIETEGQIQNVLKTQELAASSIARR